MIKKRDKRAKLNKIQYLIKSIERCQNFKAETKLCPEQTVTKLQIRVTVITMLSSWLQKYCKIIDFYGHEIPLFPENL